MIKTTKNNIRSQILKKLKKQKEVERLKRSFKIHKKLFSLPEFIKAKIIFFYLSFDGEVETFRMIEKAISLGKKVAVPVIKRSVRKLLPSLIEGCDYGLEVGPYGVYQPKASHIRHIPLRTIDLIIVPAVAFDLKGNRIGRGLGYYDRFLRSLPHKVPSVGLAFDFQVLDKVLSAESHDCPVDRILYA
jgi:5-formyltetrahydrofolate cyclo-ligase